MDWAVVFTSYRNQKYCPFTPNGSSVLAINFNTQIIVWKFLLFTKQLTFWLKSDKYFHCCYEFFFATNFMFTRPIFGSRDVDSHFHWSASLAELMDSTCWRHQPQIYTRNLLRNSANVLPVAVRMGFSASQTGEDAQWNQHERRKWSDQGVEDDEHREFWCLTCRNSSH